jgi:hypothetical protein
MFLKFALSVKLTNPCSTSEQIYNTALFFNVSEAENYAGTESEGGTRGKRLPIVVKY